MISFKRRILIKGERVHNVGYRPFLMEKAQELKIPNFHATNVKDKEDGKQVVDVRVGGEGGRVEKFLKYIHENLPEFADVESITVEEKEYEEDIMTVKEFSSVLSASQLSKIVQTGLGMLEMQKQALGKHDQTLEKQDSMLDKQDQTIATIKSGNEMLATKQDQMLGKQDQMLEKQDQMLGKQDHMLGKQDQMLGKQDQMLGKQDQMIDKQDVMIGKQDQTVSIIKSGVDEMREFREENKTILQDFHHDTIQRFDNLDAKYGKIAENIERILEELKEERKEYRESIEKLVNAIIESRKGVGGAND